MKKTGSRDTRGSGLATVLVITAIMVTLSFTVAGLSFHHLSTTNRMSNTIYAKDLAEAAIAKAIDQVISNPTFGTSSGANVSVTSAGAPSGAFGSLTFDTAQAASLTHDFGGGQMTWRRSTNNAASDAPTTGDGIMVPGNAVFLSAVGYCQGTYRRVEAVIYIPKFPFAVASSGAISGTGLQITSLKPGGDPANKSDWAPASVATNSNAGENAVDFSGGNIVLNGDLQSHSGATLGTNTSITGSERLNSGTQTLPALTISNYDTAGKTGLHTLPNVIGSTTLTGYNRRQGDLVAANGLNLNGGVLFVNGNLSVSGGLSGSGAVIVNGTTNIQGSTVFSGTNKVSILSHDSLTIQGQSPASPSQISGIIYSDKSITASYAQLRGTVIANDPSGSNGKIGITQSQLIQDNTLTDVSVTVSSSIGKNGATGGGFMGTPINTGANLEFNGTGITSVYNAMTNSSIHASDVQASNVFNQSNVSSFGYPTSTTPGTPFYGIPTGLISVNITAAAVSTTQPSRFLDPATGSYVAPLQLTVNTVDNASPPNTYAPGVYKMVLNPDDPTKFTYVPYTGTVAPLGPADYGIKIDTAAPVSASSNWQPAAVTAMVSALNQRALATRGTPLSSTESSIATSVYTTQIATWLEQAQKASGFAIALGDLSRGSNPMTFQDALDPNYQYASNTDFWSLSLNDNSIMPLAERIRVMYWRDTP